MISKQDLIGIKYRKVMKRKACSYHKLVIFSCLCCPGLEQELHFARCLDTKIQITNFEVTRLCLMIDHSTVMREKKLPRIVFYS